tara:strand:+ start:7637 stop:8866 length:1230 start_codon:yes stop_codon:yes gene_type:complete
MRWLLVLLFLVFLAGVDAAPLEVVFEREEYGVGETVQVRITDVIGLQEDLEISNIKLVDGVGGEVSAAFFFIDVKQNESFLFFDVPSVENGTYSLVFEDLLYFASNFLVVEDYAVNLTVVEKNVSLSVFPGAYILRSPFSEPSFSFRVSSYKADVGVNVSSSDFIKTKPLEFSLREGGFEDVKVFVDLNFVEGEGYVLFDYGDTYRIPVFAPFAVDEVGDLEISEDEIDVRFIEITEISKTLDEEDVVSGLLEVGNFGVGNLTNLEFKLDPSLEDVVRMDLSNVSYFGSGEIISQYLWINEKGVVGNYSGNLTFGNSDFSIGFPIFVSVFPKEEEVVSGVNESENVSSEIVRGTLNDSGVVVDEEGSGIWWWILFGVLVILFIGGGYLFYLKKSRPEDFEDFLDGVMGK